MRTIFRIIIALTLAQQCFCVEKERTIIVCMPTDNALLLFVRKNHEDMKPVAVAKNANATEQPNTHDAHQKKRIRLQICIFKNQTTQVHQNQCMNSGDEKTLIDALVFVEKEFPTKINCFL